MATDLTNFKDMLDRADIPFEEMASTTKRSSHLVKSGGQVQLVGEESPITVVSVERGYAGFITEFAFDRWGKLLNMGAWE